MFFPRLISTHCVLVLLVISSLEILCMASAVGSASRKTNTDKATAPGLKKPILANNCTTSKPAFPPSLYLKPCFVLATHTSMFLQITPDGQAKGSYTTNNYTELELEIVGTCLIRIKGIATGKYLAMRNVTSEIYTQVQPDLDAVFRFQVIRDYFWALESYQYGWYVGMKNGRSRKVNRKKKFGSFAFLNWSTQSGQGLKPLSL